MAKHKNAPVKIKIADAFDNGKSEIESLKEEIESWAENLEGNEGLSQTEKCQQVRDCADLLETAMQSLEEAESSITEDAIKKKYEAVEIEYTEMVPYKGRGFPRWMRSNNAVTALEAVRDKIESDTKDEKDVAVKNTMESILESIDSAIGELSNADYPGMF